MASLVTLSQQPRKYRDRIYKYWFLRWQTSDGRVLSMSLGSVESMSRREASKRRQQKENELTGCPRSPRCLSKSLPR